MLKIKANQNIIGELHYHIIGYQKKTSTDTKKVGHYYLFVKEIHNLVREEIKSC